ncbi:MAG: class I SAM-dependent methyltransferase [Polyangiaceae bacterium]
MAFEPQVPPAHYQGLGYDNKERFISYWMQVNEVMRVSPKRVLEIGIGNGFVHRYLRGLGVDVHTLDADPRLEPDTVGLVTELPFSDAEFDVVCCFETLEHLPFESFSRAARELRRVAARWVLISLPDVTPYFRIRFELGFHKKWLDKFFDLPNGRPRSHSFDGEHYWEVGKRGYPLSRIVSELETSGLVVEATPRVEEDAWHRFFRCRVPR